MTIGMAIIGCGRMGRMHARQVKMCKSTELKAIVDPVLDHPALESLGLQVPLMEWRQVLRDPSIQALIIAAPSSQHVDLICEAAAHGKHIFCEKPIALKLPAIQRAMDAVQEAGVLLQVGFNRRFDANFQKAKEMVRAGTLGRVHWARIISRDPIRPRLDFIPQSGGLFMDLNIHDFDMLRFVTGEKIKSVFAHGANVVDPEIGKRGDIDTAVLTLRLESNALAVIDSCRETNFGYDQRLEMVGDQGGFEVQNTTPTTVERWDQQGRHADRPHWGFVERYEEAFKKQLWNFVNSVQNQIPTVVDLQDAYWAVATALAAKRSLQKHRPVQVEEILEEQGVLEENAHG